MSDNFSEFEIRPGEGQAVEVRTDSAGWVRFTAGDIVKFLNAIYGLEWIEDDLTMAIEEYELKRKINLK